MYKSGLYLLFNPEKGHEKMIYRIIFSPTGGTEKAAGFFTDSFAKGSNTKFIDLTNMKENFAAFKFTKRDICIFAVPAFGGRIPVTAAERM